MPRPFPAAGPALIHPGQLRVLPTDAPAERISFAPPDRWRVETDDGRLRYLATDAGYFQWRPGRDGVAGFQPRRPGFRQTAEARSGVTLAFQTPDGRPIIASTELSTGLELPAETFAVPVDHG